MRQFRVLLADDHKIVLEGLKKLLEPHFGIAGAVEDGRALVATALRTRPDVILLDISMLGLNGIEAARRLQKELPAAKIIFLTMHADPIYLTAASRAGARGYILKRCAAAELVEAIRQVLKGRTYITSEISEHFPATKLKGEKKKTELTDREREILQLVAEGKSAKEIAFLLNISPKTVAFHKSNIMARLGLRTTADLTRFSIRHGIVEG
jgi:DNA-binding NarL/FixJ family response regulator